LITIVEFRGDAAEAARFTESCWRRSYSGSSFYALWTEAYMRWQLFDVPAPERVRRLGAYVSDQLVGFFAAEEMDFTTRNGPRLGTMSSWLSVDPEHGRAGIGRALRRAMWAWQHDRGADFMIGFVNAGTVRGQGRRFWTREVLGAVILRRPALWGHILRPAAAAAAEFSRLEAAGVRLLAQVQRTRRAASLGQIRAYRDEDLAKCRALFAAGPDDFAYAWNDARLAHQLRHSSMPRTLLLDRGSGVEALINYYTLDMVGRQPVRCAIVDFIRSRQGQGECSGFVRHCLEVMASEGHDVALTLGPPAHPSIMLVAGGFLPLLPMQSPIFLPVTPGTTFPGGRRLQIHWR
jgi:GNAT superfamily N-acetyltransferase